MSEQQPIPTNWVSREDLLYCCPELAEQINAMAAHEIDYLASKVGDALSEVYWMALDMALHDYFEEDTNKT